MERFELRVQPLLITLEAPDPFPPPIEGF
jgi:hypothetical protein